MECALDPECVDQSNTGYKMHKGFLSFQTCNKMSNSTHPFKMLWALSSCPSLAGGGGAVCMPSKCL